VSKTVAGWVLAATIAVSIGLAGFGLNVRHGNGDPSLASIALWLASAILFVVGLLTAIASLRQRADAESDDGAQPGDLWIAREISIREADWSVGIRIHNDSPRLAVLYAQMVSFDPGASELELHGMFGFAPYWLTGTRDEQAPLVIAPHSSEVLSLATGTTFCRMPDGQWAWIGNRMTPVSEFSYIVPNVAIVKYRRDPVAGVVKVWQQGSDALMSQFKFQLDLDEGGDRVEPRLNVEEQRRA
jgi:hypothetical protein